MLTSLTPYYQYIYTILIAIFTIYVAKLYTNEDGIINVEYNDNINRDVLIVLLLIAFLGLRPISSRYFVDMAGYAEWYYLNEGNPFVFTLDTDNKIFDNLFGFWISARLGVTSFFVFIATIYFGCSYIGIRKLFPGHTLPAYLTFLAAFSTFSYATNGIKAGAAASIFIMALGFWDKKVIFMILALISLGFHHSMVLPVTTIALVYFFKNPKWYFYGWAICFIIALLHITYFQELFGGMSDEQGAGYLIVKDTLDTRIEFRPDFVLYSSVPVIIGYYYELKYKLSTEIYSTLLHFYLVTNGVWMLCMYAAFNNRIAYLSWFVYPIVLIYPFLYVDESKNRYLNFSKSMRYHLYFTLFMVFIYYGLLHLGT